MDASMRDVLRAIFHDIEDALELGEATLITMKDDLERMEFYTQFPFEDDLPDEEFRELLRRFDPTDNTEGIPHYNFTLLPHIKEKHKDAFYSWVRSEIERIDGHPPAAGGRRRSRKSRRNHKKSRKTRRNHKRSKCVK